MNDGSTPYAYDNNVYSSWYSSSGTTAELHLTFASLVVGGMLNVPQWQRDNVDWPDARGETL
jgi:hypothetical protein